MNTSAHTHDRSRTDLCLSVPADLFADLERLADRHDTTLEDLVFSYVVEGIAGDPRHGGRLSGDTRKPDGGSKSFYEKSAREIISDLNISYGD